MSQFRIQRKLTEGAAFKQKQPLPQPTRFKSLESKRSFARSPKRNDYSSLKKLVQKIAVRKPTQLSDFPKTKLEEGIKAYKQKNVDKATELFKEIYKNGIRSAELTFYLGSCLLNSGKYQASIMYLNECISLNPSFNPHAYLYIAISFKCLGNFKQSVKILEQGLEVFPNFQQILFYRAKLLMKMGEFSQAIYAFQYCLRVNPYNDLALLFLGDCYRSHMKKDKAIVYYQKIIESNRKYVDLAAIRTAGILFEKKQYQKMYEILSALIARGVQNPQINYYIGLACCGLDRKQESVVYLQSCLSATKDSKLAAKTIKRVLIIAIESNDFYEAEHQISRISKFQFEQENFREWRLFVQGVSDLIKRKHSAGCLKLQQALEIATNKLKNDRTNYPEHISLLTYIHKYLAYAFYVTDKAEAAMEMYDLALEHNSGSFELLYCRLVVEGLLLQGSNQFEQSVSKFNEAFKFQKRSEALFMAAITLVRQYKAQNEQKEKTLGIAEQYLIRASQCEGKNNLILFYYSLLLLFLNRPCVEVIEKAIQCCDDSISQYYFIYALGLQNAGKPKEALQAICRAIQIDSGILQFYRQRSKYYFLNEQYNLAIEDCRKAEEMEPQDEEIQLLLSFYLYLVDQIEDSYDYLKKIKPSAGKLYEFELALHLRLGHYDRLGSIGDALMFISGQNLADQSFFDVLQKFISERNQYSEFSVYFYHLILSAAFTARKDYEKALGHLFGCLQEIQILIDEKDGNHNSFDVTWEETEAMLDEIKFNITLVSLLLSNVEETERYIESFSKETSSEELKEALLHIGRLLKDYQHEGEIVLFAKNEEPKISDKFPDLQIPINKATLITKLLVSYPVKLKFTIAPEFDPAYLLNFDLEKIEYKVPPPWMKSPEKRLNFTNQICQQSIKLSESGLSQRQSQLSLHSNLAEKLKLDKSIEAKLQKIIHK